jgi:Kelch motif
MSTPRFGAVAAPLPDGRVLVAGGSITFTFGPDPFAQVDLFLSSAEVFDPATNSFSSAGIGSMSIPRERAVAAPLPDGRVLVAGGLTGPPDQRSQLSSAEVFDPATNSFSSAGIGSLSTPRDGAVAAPLPDGRVLVAGGYGRDSDLSSAEIFAAANGFTFSLKGKKLIVRLEASGKVAVSDAAAPLSASAATKKRKLRLRPSSASGDPPTIVVRLRLTKPAKAQLKKKGKVKVKARITFTPQGGLANTQTAKLRLKSKKRRSKKG